MVVLNNISKRDIVDMGFSSRKDFFQFAKDFGIKGKQFRGRGAGALIPFKQFIKDIKVKEKKAKKRKKRGRKRKEKKVTNLSSGVNYRLLEVDSINNFNSFRVFSNAGTEEEMYDIIQDIIEKKGDIPYVALFFVNKRTGKIRKATINSNFLISLELFIQRIDELRQGTAVEGSDAIGEAEYDLLTDKFDMTFVNIIRGFGDSDCIVFDCVGIDTKDKTCFKGCFKELCPKFYEENKEFRNRVNTSDPTLDNLNKIIHDYDLEISVIGNSFTYKKKFLELVRSKNLIKSIIKGSRIFLFKVEDEDVKHFMYDEEDSNEMIIFDYKNKHFDVVRGVPKLNNIYSDISKNIYKKVETDKGERFKKIFTATELYKNNVESGLTQRTNNVLEYIFIDYETVVNWGNSNAMQPYSLSLFHATDEILDDLNNLDEKHHKFVKEITDLVELKYNDRSYDERQKIIKNGISKSKDIRDNKKKINKIIKARCKFYLSYNCTDDLMKYIEKNQSVCDKETGIIEKKIFMLGTFNGANFDNFILLNDLLKNPKYLDKVSNIFYNGTQLLKFNINVKHNLFDIRKHLSGSLSKNCKDFNISFLSKKSFDHRIAQNHYDNDNLMNYMNQNKKEIETYNNFDVLSTGLLYYKYKKAIGEIKGFEEYSVRLDKYKTIGGVIYNRFEEHLKEKKITLPKFTIDKKRMKDFKGEKIGDVQEKFFKYYKDILKYKVAGRVEVFNGPEYLNERCISVDVCSEYPYVCSILDEYYPGNGEMIEVNKFEKMPKGSLGFFYCDIDQSELEGKNLPLIICEKTKFENKWDSKIVLEKYLISTQMIKLLLKYISKDKLKIYNGFYFSKKVKSCDMFGFLKDLMKIKNEQDMYKKTGDSRYNPSLRAVVKLLSNAISGKVIESLHTQKIEAMNREQFEKMKKSPKTKSINAINIVENKAFIKYEVEEESIFSKHRPVYLGVLIYDYAKSYMYENLYSVVGKKGMLYTDTDSGKIRLKDFIKWRDEYASKTNVRHWKEIEEFDSRYKDHKLFESNSKVYGSFEDELEESNNLNIFIAKKCYLSMTIDEKGDPAKEYNKKTEKMDPVPAHFCFKGVGSNDMLLDLNESILEKKYYKKSTLKYYEINGILFNSKGEIMKYNEIEDLNQYELKCSLIDDREAYLYYNNNESNKIKNNYKKLFDRLYEKKEAYILCQNIRKSVNNMKRNVDLDNEEKMNNTMNNIVVGFSVKHITIKEEK